MAKPKTSLPNLPPIHGRLVWDDQKRPRVRLFGQSWSIEVVLPPDCTDAEAGRRRDAYVAGARNEELQLSPLMRAFPIAPEPTAPDSRVEEAASDLFLRIFPDAAADAEGPELRPRDVEAHLASGDIDPVRRAIWRLCCLVAGERQRTWRAWSVGAQSADRAGRAERDLGEEQAAAAAHSARWSDVANQVAAFVHVARALVRRLQGSEAASEVLALVGDIETPEPLVFPSVERARKAMRVAQAIGLGGFGVLSAMLGPPPSGFFGGGRTMAR